MTGAARLGLAGLALVALARLALPGAPPIYDSAPIPAPPYNYASPPPDLRSSNKAPASGSKTFRLVGGGNQVGTAETADQQMVVYFNEGILTSPGATTIVVKIEPATDPPPPPAPSAMVGNDYRITALGEPGDLPVTLKGSAQVLLQVPPVNFSSVRIYYDSAWHSLAMTVEPPRVNVALDHLGDLAAFEDPTAPYQHSGTPVNWLAIVDSVVIAAALLVIVVAVVRRRRAAKSRDS
ncbi:MAG TPA: hypothetical protein VG245_10825 [Candidatus Dormibacteraeota bacterium]|nr:hypothetical protein [Candidatus Dormibacteraeota bacterium]